MNEPLSHEQLLDKCAVQNPTYPRAAYAFVCHAVRDVANELAKQQQGAPRHISGQELCEGLRKLLIRHFGRLTAAVLSHWNISETTDFGNIVYALVDVGLLSVSAEDSRTDFTDVYRFHEAYVKPFLCRSVATPLPVIDFL